MRRFEELGAWVVAVLLSGAFLLTGGMKLMASPDMASSFQRWGYPGGFMTVVGVVEVVAAALMLFPMTAFYGAMAIVTIMAGAAVTHVVHGEYLNIIVPLVLASLALWLAWTRRPAWLGGLLTGRELKRGQEFVSAMPGDDEWNHR